MLWLTSTAPTLDRAFGKSGKGLVNVIGVLVGGGAVIAPTECSVIYPTPQGQPPAALQHTSLYNFYKYT